MTTLYVLVGFIAFCEFLQLIRMLVAWRNNIIVKQQMGRRLQKIYERTQKDTKGKREK